MLGFRGKINIVTSFDTKLVLSMWLAGAMLDLVPLEFALLIKKNIKAF